MVFFFLIVCMYILHAHNTTQHRIYVSYWFCTLSVTKLCIELIMLYLTNTIVQTNTQNIYFMLKKPSVGL